MKNYLLLLSVLVLASCETFKAFRSPSSVKPKHYVIAIHGLNGAPESFKALLPVIEQHLTAVNSNFEVVPMAFKYSSGEKGADIERFVSEFENYLVKEIPVINPEDKISLIAHSQGGLVGYIWYLKTMDGVDLKQRAYMERVNGFVTSGSPFWGSRTTFLLKKLIPAGMQDFVFDNLHYSDQEIIDITSASEKIYSYFSKMAQKNYVNIYYDPRMLNISAVVPATKGDEVPKNKILKFINDMKNKVVKIFDYRLNVGNRWESDQAVNVSSARLGFYYYSDAITRMVEQEKHQNLTMEDFDYSRFFKTDPKYIMVEGTHTPASAYAAGYAVAAIPEECIEPQECKSTGYIHIFKHVANCEDAKTGCNMDRYTDIVKKLEVARSSLSLETNEMIRNDMRTFNLGFDLELPKDFVPPKEMLDSKTLMNYLQVDYYYGSDNKKQLNDVKKDGLVNGIGPVNYEIRIGRMNELGSRIVNYSADKNKLQIQLTGNVQPIDTAGAFDVNKKYPLQLIINIPGLKKRKLVIPLQPTYTTFLDLQLD